MLLYHHFNDQTVLKAGIKQPLAVGQTRLRVSLCLKKDTHELYDDGTLECWNHSKDISNLYF